MKGHIRRRGERSWAIVLDLPPDLETGKRRQKRHTVKGTKRDAQRRLTDLLKEMQDSTYMEPSRHPARAHLHHISNAGSVGRQVGMSQPLAVPASLPARASTPQASNPLKKAIPQGNRYETSREHMVGPNAFSGVG